MFDDGLFMWFLCDVVFVMYNVLGLLVGVFGFCDGFVMVLVDEVCVCVIGCGGYGVVLYMMIDLVVVCVLIVMVL